MESVRIEKTIYSGKEKRFPCSHYALNHDIVLPASFSALQTDQIPHKFRFGRYVCTHFKSKDRRKDAGIFYLFPPVHELASHLSQKLFPFRLVFSPSCLQKQPLSTPFFLMFRS